MVRSLTGCLVLAGTVAAFTQGPPLAEPAKAGLTPARVGDIDAVMARYTAPDRFPGAVLLIARRNAVGYWRAFGARDVAIRAPMEPNDLFRVFSLTKPIVAAALMTLQEEGLVRLDDPVSKYIPEFARQRVYDGSADGRPPVRPMTIRHLLSYTSGLTYGIYGATSPADAIVREAKVNEVSDNLDDAVRRLARLPLVSDPGAAVSYGYQMDVIGKVIEVVSGQSLDQFLAQRIFGPLGMVETGFYAPSASLSRMPALLMLAPGQSPALAPASEWTGAYGTPPRVLWGGHGLVSTPADYLRFARMIAGDGELNGRRILSRESVRLMTSAQVDPAFPGVRERLGPGWAYGFGCAVAVDPAVTGARRPGGVFYFSGAANLFTWIDRDRDVIGLVWAQSLPYQIYPLLDDVRRAVARAVDEAAR